MQLNEDIKDNISHNYGLNLEITPKIFRREPKAKPTIDDDQDDFAKVRLTLDRTLERTFDGALDGTFNGAFDGALDGTFNGT